MDENPQKIYVVIRYRGDGQSVIIAIKRTMEEAKKVEYKHADPPVTDIDIEEWEIGQEVECEE